MIQQKHKTLEASACTWAIACFAKAAETATGVLTSHIHLQGGLMTGCLNSNSKAFSSSQAAPSQSQEDK